LADRVHVRRPGDPRQRERSIGQRLKLVLDVGLGKRFEEEVEVNCQRRCSLTEVVVKPAGQANALGLVCFDQQRLDRGVIPESHSRTGSIVIPCGIGTR
jgi:hypothetical protein